MAETPTSPPKAQEPVTTREELDFDNDNDNEQETGTVSPLGSDHPNTAAAAAAAAAAGTAAKPASPRPRVSFQDGQDEIPPQKPPRPLSPNVQAENTLIEAFPSIDAKVVRAVLQASGGKVEPAFNALLGMTDPDFNPEEQAPPQPPRPKQRQPISQLEADELYARRLAEQYNSAPSRAQYNQREPGRRAPNRQPRAYDEDEDRDRNFFDDDLPEIGKNIQQGFMETQKRVNSWINNFKKKIDGVEDDDEDLYASSRQGTGPSPGRKNFGPSQSEQMYGIRKSAEAQRRSTEAQRYDADPHEFDANEFERLELKDEETPPPMPPRTSSRAKANPDLFKSQPKPSQSGPVDEVDAAERKNTDPEKAKKWQPLTSVAPNPEEDNDPFSLGDDEEDAKDKGEDVAKDATERLKKQASNSVSAGSSGDGAKVLQESARSGSIGTRDKEAEELLSGSGKTV